MKFIAVFCILLFTVAGAVDLAEIGKLIPQNHDLFFVFDAANAKKTVKENAPADLYGKIMLDKVRKYKEITGHSVGEAFDFITGFADVRTYSNEFYAGIIVHGRFHRDQVEGTLNTLLSAYRMEPENYYGRKIFYFKEAKKKVGITLFSSKKLIIGTREYLEDVLTGKILYDSEPANLLGNTIAKFSQTCGYIKIRPKMMDMIKDLIGKKANIPQLALLTPLLSNIEYNIYALNSESFMKRTHFSNPDAAKTTLNFIEGIKTFALNYTASIFAQNAAKTDKNPALLLHPEIIQREYSARVIEKIVYALHFSVEGSDLVTRISRSDIPVQSPVIGAAVVGVLAAIAIPNFQKARETAKMKACMANMRTLESGVEMYNMEHDTVLKTLDMKKIAEYFKSIPRCPSGGTYRLNKDGYVECSKHGTVDNPRK